MDFFERTVKKIKENISCRVSFSLQTNGLLIDGDYARFFKENGLILSAENYSYFLKELFDLWYDDYIKGEYISIRHIDNYIGILLGNPPENCAMCGVCGKYFVVEANGDIFPCDFYCKDELRLGSVFDDKPFDENEKQKQFIEQSFIIHRECEKCKYYPLCRGECRRDRVNFLTENKYCSAYKEFFSYALERMIEITKGI